MKLAWGSTRVAILTKRRAYKVPYPTAYRNFLQGLIANMDEVLLSPVIGDDYLCPVLWSLPMGFLVVMPRVRTTTREELSEFESTNRFKNFPVYIESKPCSWGWYNGKVVAIDYGGMRR